MAEPESARKKRKCLKVEDKQKVIDAIKAGKHVEDITHLSSLLAKPNTDWLNVITPSYMDLKPINRAVNEDIKPRFVASGSASWDLYAFQSTQAVLSRVLAEWEEGGDSSRNTEGP
eukprot:Em0007g660a